MAQLSLNTWMRRANQNIIVNGAGNVETIDMVRIGEHADDPWCLAPRLNLSLQRNMMEPLMYEIIIDSYKKVMPICEMEKSEDDKRCSYCYITSQERWMTSIPKRWPLTKIIGLFHNFTVMTSNDYRIVNSQSQRIVRSEVQ